MKMQMKALSVCITLALGIPQSYAAGATCPKDISKLSKAEKSALPADCQKTGFTDQQLWITGGAIAGVAAVVGIAMAAGGGGGGGGGNSEGDKPVPPSDGGDKPVPPSDGGDTPVPPSDGGDTPVPPSDGGDTPVPPSDGGDTPVPPSDGGDTPVPPVDPVAQTTTYPNGLSVTMIKGDSTATLTLNGVSMEATKQSDGTWLITDPATGKTYVAQTLDRTTGEIKGYSIVDRKLWTLDGTTPIGIKKWASSYSLLNSKGTSLALTDGQFLNYNASASEPLVIENAGTLTGFKSTLQESPVVKWHISQIKVGENSLFLNTGTMKFTRSMASSDNNAASQILITNKGTLFNAKGAEIKFGDVTQGDEYSYPLGGSIGMLDNSTMVNHGQINATGAIKIPASYVMNNRYESVFTFGGSGTSNSIYWENAADGVITASHGYNVITDDTRWRWVDGSNGGYLSNAATQSGVTINAVNNGLIDFTAPLVSSDPYHLFAAISFGMASNNSPNSNISTFINNGTITVKGDGATALYGEGNSTLVNNGTINLGSKENSIADNGTGLTAFKAEGEKVTAYNQGTVNINANQSYVFDRNGTTTAHLVNTGTVNVRDGVTEWGLVRGENASVVDTTSVYRSTIKNYTVGTKANGTTGTMNVSHANLKDVSVDTKFTEGTDAKTKTFDNVFTGQDIQGTQNVKSTSAVWNARAQTDTNGNVDVTMTKRSYQDVVKDSAGLQNMASKLENNYTNNALYNSLNLKTSADVESAMRQLSGANATSAFKEARVLSQRFNMLADNAIVMPSGFGFNLVDKNDKRAELGNDTRYDMMALSQSFDLSASQKMQMQYGIARLDGNGVNGKQKAGDNGITGGYSQFFGLNHSVDMGHGLTLTNALRYDVHQLESNRSIRYSGANQTAKSDNSQQYMEWRSGFSKGFDVAEGLSLTPSAGLKLRHTANNGYSERGAGDFNLTMDDSNETAVDALIGLKLKFATSNGWSVNALAEGGPNVSYNQSAQTASLQGAGNSRFMVDNDQKGGGINGVISTGVSYDGEAGRLAFDAYQWKEDSVSDKGILMNYQYNF
ncbi:autotransporter domain-containing protein [Ewingella americana]|uniref:autotransporter domain-containing protein n=1 Tax=Ewingella americana TaxID=41202 RepID=UPI0012AD35ED|nr:autotransporter domain-containing protein [Ewingella americana]MRT05677.1 autotransporter domain-containing protein [Ewingella americana]